MRTNLPIRGSEVDRSTVWLLVKIDASLSLCASERLTDETIAKRRDASHRRDFLRPPREIIARRCDRNPPPALPPREIPGVNAKERSMFGATRGNYTAWRTRDAYRVLTRQAKSTLLVSDASDSIPPVPLGATSAASHPPRVYTRQKTREKVKARQRRKLPETIQPIFYVTSPFDPCTFSGTFPRRRLFHGFSFPIGMPCQCQDKLSEAFSPRSRARGI